MHVAIQNYIYVYTHFTAVQMQSLDKNNKYEFKYLGCTMIQIILKIKDD